MKKTTVVLAVVLSGLFMAVVGGGLMWLLLSEPANDSAKVVQASPAREYKYVSLDKVIVMLRTAEGAPMSSYLAMDIVFKTPLESEKIVKQHLPLLRSIAVKALSTYTLERATQMTVEEFAVDINRAYTASYADEKATKPFAEAMVGKLIIE